MHWIWYMSNEWIFACETVGIKCVATSSATWNGVGVAFHTGHYVMRHSFPLRAVNKSFQTTTTEWNFVKKNTQYLSIPVGFDSPCVLFTQRIEETFVMRIRNECIAVQFMKMNRTNGREKIKKKKKKIKREEKKNKTKDHSEK